MMTDNKTRSMRINLFHTGIITTALCLLLQTTSYAGVYRWVDKNGQVNYSDQPVSSNAEEVNIRQNTTTKPRETKKTEDDKKDPDAKNPNAETPDTENTEQKAAEAKEVEISTKEKRRLCKEASSDIAAINSRGRMREINEKGEYTYLAEEQRQQRLAAAKKKRAKYCR